MFDKQKSVTCFNFCSVNFLFYIIVNGIPLASGQWLTKHAVLKRLIEHWEGVMSFFHFFLNFIKWTITQKKKQKSVRQKEGKY